MLKILERAKTVTMFGAVFLMQATALYAQEEGKSVRQQINENLTNVGQIVGIETGRTIGMVVGGVIQVALGLLGLIFLIILVYGGFKWMESKGEDKKVQEAQGMMYQAIIGLAITLAAFTIAEFFTGYLQTAAGFPK